MKYGIQPTQCGTSHHIACGFRSGLEHPLPESTYDFALPLGWRRDVADKLNLPSGVNLGGHIVWRYGPDDGLFGAPYGLCQQGKDIIDAYNRSLSPR